MPGAYTAHMTEQLLTTAAWASPLGLGVFMACLGIFMICFGFFVYLCGRAGDYKHNYWSEEPKETKKK
jgi:hypothetical protein